MNLRYYIERKEVWRWDSRNDEWFKSVRESEPVLQTMAHDGTWKNVPTVTTTVEPAGPKPTH